MDNLQEIASYLHVTPVTVSKIRRELLLEFLFHPFSQLFLHDLHAGEAGGEIGSLAVAFFPHTTKYFRINFFTNFFTKK